MNQFSVSLLLLVVSMCPSPAWSEDSELSVLFASKGLDGTIVISSLDGRRSYIHNERRAKEAFVPASTFKILNTLIALEEKAVANENEIINWDGKEKEYPEWNRNHTLETAFKTSCVWCFQELAHRVGGNKYQQYLQKAGYGNLQGQLTETAFWLDDRLTIDAISQVDFLKKIYRKELAFSPLSYETLRKVMVVEQTPAYTLRAKTGWAERVRPQTGWYVGYIETQNDIWFFATNIEVRSSKDLPYRQQITREALILKGII